MEVRLADFRRQLDWLSGNREVVDLGEALVRWEEPGAERLVVLTFDDGYRDNYTTAFPLLKELGLPFTLYLATDSIETGVPLGPPSGAEPLSWEQIGTMLESGLVTVGAHTHRHLDLRQLSIDEVESELGTSDDLIEKRLGIRPLHFAYPWGFWSPTSDRAVSRAVLVCRPRRVTRSEGAARTSSSASLPGAALGRVSLLQRQTPGRFASGGDDSTTAQGLPRPLIGNGYSFAREGSSALIQGNRARPK